MKLRIMLGVVLVSCLFVKAGFAGQQVIPELIRAVPAAGTKFATVNPSPDDQAIRQRDVVLDLDSLRELGKTLGAEPTTAQYVRVSFFSDATWLVELQRVEPTYSGGVAYLGRIPGVANSIAVLVDNDGVTSMQINALSQRFSITGSRESGYVVKELGEPLRRDHPREPTVVNAPPMPIATPMTGVSGDTIEIARDDGSTMDVMVVYTLAARTQNGSVAQINANIDAQIALTNTIYANSNVVQRLRLVYRGETNYTEVNMDTDLPRLRDGTDGFMDDVPVLRDIYKADFVSLWGAYSDYCGLGYLMGTESSGFAASAFNIVASPSCTAANSYTFAHELGHNMGLRHDNFVDLTANTTVTPEAGGAAVAIQYAHGYIDLTNRFRTVMSYNEQCIAGGFNCTRIPHFSNPSVSFNNVSGYASAVLATTGNVSNAHERQALNDTRDTTANFRTALASLTGPGAISFVLPAYSIVESAGTIQIPVARHVGSTGSVSISYASASGSATSGSDFTGVSGTLSWADGDTTTKFISVSILQDAVLEGPETFSIALSSPTGGATIGSGLIATTVTIRDDELDNFPAACAIGPGWTTPPGATTGWIVASDDYYGATCSLKSNVMANATVGAVNKAQIQFAGNFVAGNITFARRVSSESGWDCFRFLVDGVTQGVGGSCAGIGGTGASGELGWGVVSIPVTAGFHTLVWSYEKDDSATGGSDAAWIDSVVLPLAPTIAKQSDFNGDGKSDMVYRNDQTGQVYIVGRNGLAAGPVSGFAVTVPNLSWKIVGMADFNGDGKADILYRHDTTGQVFVYLMDGTSIIGSGFVLTEANLAWKIIAAADFNGDGKADILYRNDVTGQVYVYFMNGTVLAGGGGFIVTVPNLSWKIVGVGDFNGDGKADLLYWNDTTGQVYVYFVNGATTIGGGFVLTESNLNWKIISVADFNGDGKADILYRHDVTGQVYVYFGNGATTNGGGFIVTAPNLSWKVVATGDYNGDGKADLLYRNDVTGEVFIYLVNGSTTTSGGFVYTEPNLAWKVLN